MKLIPVLTEKSLEEARRGSYTFLVDRGLNKDQIKKRIESVFGVHVTGVNTLNIKALSRKNLKGYIQREKGAKKAIVTLKDKEKIDLFEEKKK